MCFFPVRMYLTRNNIEGAAPLLLFIPLSSYFQRFKPSKQGVRADVTSIHYQLVSADPSYNPPPSRLHVFLVRSIQPFASFKGAGGAAADESTAEGDQVQSRRYTRQQQ